MKKTNKFDKDFFSIPYTSSAYLVKIRVMSKPATSMYVKGTYNLTYYSFFLVAFTFYVKLYVPLT
ncbi:MAG: hypothetical protein ACYCZ1_02575 [Candidatus Humimicrobiaceae bacterium]